MAKILVGIASVCPDRRFLQNLPSFFCDIGKQHEIETLWVWGKKLVDAQNEFADKLLSGDYEYLLTLEDDHWGFNADMLEALLEMKVDVATVAYRSRHFPFKKIPMKYIGTDDKGTHWFDEDPHKEGIHQTDLVGFGFTLITRHAIKVLSEEPPIFRENNDDYYGVGPKATDLSFCDRLKRKGVHPVGNWNYQIAHRDITEQSYKEFIVKGVIEKHTMLDYLKKQAPQNPPMVPRM